MCDINSLTVLEIFDSKIMLREKYPQYYIPAIMGCCQGNKNSYKGFKWHYMSLDSETLQIRNKNKI
jgi:hypothetical protein